MKCSLVGIQEVRFTDKETGEVVEGKSLHLVDEMKDDGDGMKGQRVLTVFVRQGVVNLESLICPCKVDLVYETVLRGKKPVSRLSEVHVLDEPKAAKPA